MKKNKLFLIAIILIIVSSTAWYIYNKKTTAANSEASYKTVKVKRDDLTVIVTTTGVVNASTQLDITSEAAGEIIELPREEGDIIKKGELLAIIDDTQQRETFVQSEASYKSTVAQLEKAIISRDYQENVTSISIKTAQEKLRQAQLEYKKALEELEEEKAISKNQIKQAEASLDIAKKQLEKSLAGSREQELAEQEQNIRQAEATMNNSRKELERQKELYEKGYVSLQDVDSAEKTFLVSEAQYKAAIEQFDLLTEGTMFEELEVLRAQVKQSEESLALQVKQSEQNINTKERELELAANSLNQAELSLTETIEDIKQVEIKNEEITAAEADLEKAKATRNQALDDLEKTKIVSPLDGIIISRDVELGDVVSSQTKSVGGGTVLMTIADLGELYAEADIDEADIGKVKKGLPVTIHSSSYKEVEIPGEITFISVEAEQVEQIPTFTIKIKILLEEIAEETLPEGRTCYDLLFPGMSVDADIFIEHKEKVLQLPIEAVKNKKGKKYVTIVKEPNVFEEVEVKTGVKNSILIEIVEGVNEGDEIKIPDVNAEEEENSGRPGPPPRL